MHELPFILEIVYTLLSAASLSCCAQAHRPLADKLFQHVHLRTPRKIIQGHQTAFTHRVNSHFSEHVCFHSSLALSGSSCWVTTPSMLQLTGCCGQGHFRHRALGMYRDHQASVNHGEHEEKVTKEHRMESASHLVGLLCNQLSARHSG